MSATARRKRVLRNLEAGRHRRGAVIVMAKAKAKTKAKAVVTATAINSTPLRSIPRSGKTRQRSGIEGAGHSLGLLPVGKQDQRRDARIAYLRRADSIA